MLAQKAGHVGILGGTFNPIHYGHIELGVQALEQFRLDKVLVMPNNKPGYNRSPGQHDKTCHRWHKRVGVF